MKNTTKGKNLSKALLMGTALVSLSSFQAEAQATGTGSMSAVILVPIVATTQQTLNFGSMTVSDATGSITVLSDGTRNAGVGGITEVAGLGNEQQGILRITAATGVVMDVQMQAGPFSVDDAGAGNPMTVDTFNIGTTAAGPTVTTQIVGPATFVDLNVGATLNLGAGQRTAMAAITTPSSFTGQYKVDVDYQ